MRSKINFNLLVCGFSLVSFPSFSQEINSSLDYFNLNGTIEMSLEQNSENNLLSNSDTQYKKINFMKIDLTQKMIDKIDNANNEMNLTGGEYDYSKGIIRFSDSQGAVDLGMANVPVLDQGQYGTCVTFASTAILDARFKMGDYIDQQCSLALDYTLGNSYWNGAYTANNIILPLKKYGIIAKNYCFGYRYPYPNQTVNLNQYYNTSFKGYSDSIITNNMRPDLNEIIKALNSGYRVAIGFVYNGDFPSTIIKKEGPIVSQNRGGLWACTQPGSNYNHCVPTNAGHEVIVIGYDNNQKLLKIRNSWSANMGDNGDYYMTYNFFNAMATDQTVVP
ncbi:hypothetical protein GCL60_00555 [Silvanigrella paludirubra]|uniref:Peptidase C1A papain C-terminal domain-containing protein n=1 Tax=Silvanigrella paludirubra TaxID=2499159 RepID=A0A6N6VZZ6_9BACT|nr:C1 family peptidase [Silvanigrella paludirubra]KAB8040438.1 hypothetical protein GCL60_00555 [Silvanigrella paludirubra]